MVLRKNCAAHAKTTSESFQLGWLPMLLSTAQSFENILIITIIWM